MRPFLLCLALLGPGMALAQPAGAGSAGCGEVVTVPTHGSSATRYALARPGVAPPGPPLVVVLLPGGGGDIRLDAAGCARALTGNLLVRSSADLQRAGFITALVDTPSDHRGEDGLAGFRTSPDHATDIGLLIADIRARTGATVWVLGTSRGSISAANAAARLSGAAAPDGLVLTSALMAGQSGARKPWVAQTVFDLPLEAIRLPILVVGHVADRCLRSPATLMDKIVLRSQGAREQVALVSGGPQGSGPASLEACEGRSAHGFLGQEAELIEGIARFMRGGRY